MIYCQPIASTVIYGNENAVRGLLFVLLSVGKSINSYPCTSIYFSLCTCLWMDNLPTYNACQFHSSDNIIDFRQAYAYTGNQWKF